MKSKALFTLGLLFLLAAPARAQYTVAPVQVQIELSDMLIMYDCYPGTEWGEMVVYLNRPDGIATYTCAVDGAVWRSKMLERRGVELARRVF